MMVALMFVLYSIPTLLGSITSVGDTSSDISALENTILQTEINLDTLTANASMPSLSFNLNNINTEKLWDYESFDVIVTYDADISGTRTSVTESFPYKPVELGYEILFETTSTTADTSAVLVYEFINDMRALGLTIASADSHILFHANVTVDSNAADSACRIALFIDGVMVAEAEDFADTNTTEPGNVGLTWWVTGLNPAVTHDFEVMWLEEAGSQAGCIIATDTERSMQVIEFTPGEGVPTILTEATSNSAENYPNTDTPVGSMRGSPSIDSSNSLVFTTGTVTFEDDSGGSNASCHLGIFIDGTLEAEQQTFTEGSTFGSSAGVMWAETGLSVGSHTFEFQAREQQAGCETDTAMQRHMQIVDYTSGNPTILSEVTNFTAQAMTANYASARLLTDTVNIDGPGSVVLFTSTVTFDTSPATSEGDIALFIDGSNVAEGRTYIQSVNNEQGHVNLHWWETGLSAGLHTFNVHGKEGTVGAAMNTPTQRHMQVVEFPCTKQWNVVNISNDVLDPGIINPEETAKIAVELCNPIFDSGNVVVSVSTDNGATSTISGIAT